MQPKERGARTLDPKRFIKANNAPNPRWPSSGIHHKKWFTAAWFIKERFFRLDLIPFHSWNNTFCLKGLSCSKNHFLRHNLLPYPVSEPSLPITRWQGTTIGNGFLPLPEPTARTAFASPNLLEILFSSPSMVSMPSGVFMAVFFSYQVEINLIFFGSIWNIVGNMFWFRHAGPARTRPPAGSAWRLIYLSLENNREYYFLKILRLFLTNSKQHRIKKPIV